MEENTKKPGGLDNEWLLVDRAIADPFGVKPLTSDIRTHAFDDGRTAGYIRYTIRDTALVIIDCVVTRTSAERPTGFTGE